ncbi:retrovirus-related Pol polyprotein from transposon 17.6 [Trichonephila clavipes]|nr:retrovirus-related Pol polyprotein from transposon 17.6 [Trichonephila clavipes]
MVKVSDHGRHAVSSSPVPLKTHRVGSNSKDGLGACLIQESQPISYASRSLTETEQNYAQIEKEILAIVFSVQKYHIFVYGEKFSIQIDHKSLTSIVNKPVSITLSKAYRKVKVNDDPDIYAVHTVKELPMSERRISQYKIAVQSDPEQNIVQNYYSKIVVPSILGNYMLMILHEGHFGIEKSKSRARERSCFGQK